MELKYNASFENGFLCLNKKDESNINNHLFSRSLIYNHLTKKSFDSNEDKYFEKKYGYRLIRPQIPFRIGGTIGKKRIIYQKSVV